MCAVDGMHETYVMRVRGVVGVADMSGVKAWTNCHGWFCVRVDEEV